MVLSHLCALVLCWDIKFLLIPILLGLGEKYFSTPLQLSTGVLEPKGLVSTVSIRGLGRFFFTIGSYGVWKFTKKLCMANSMGIYVVTCVGGRDV